MANLPIFLFPIFFCMNTSAENLNPVNTKTEYKHFQTHQWNCIQFPPDFHPHLQT